MPAIEDTDYFLINDLSDASYKVSAANLRVYASKYEYRKYRMLVTLEDNRSRFVYVKDLLTRLQDVHYLLIERNGVNHKVNGEQVKEYLLWRPWFEYDSGIFHVKNATDTVYLALGPHTAWDVDGSNERAINNIQAGEELVLATKTNSANSLFSSNRTADWEFGEYTDTSKVVNMDGMFYSAELFNGDVSNWDVSNVTNMRSLFRLAKLFNGDISNWDTSSVLNMGYMFDGAEAFNQDLSDWCVSLFPEITEFDRNSGFEGQTAKQPQWGTCPRGEDEIT